MNKLRDKIIYAVGLIALAAGVIWLGSCIGNNIERKQDNYQQQTNQARDNLDKSVDDMLNNMPNNSRESR